MSTTIAATILYTHTCQKCGHSWHTLKDKSRQCPKCGTRNWGKDGHK